MTICNICLTGLSTYYRDKDCTSALRVNYKETYFLFFFSHWSQIDKQHSAASLSDYGVTTIDTL